MRLRPIWRWKVAKLPFPKILAARAQMVTIVDERVSTPKIHVRVLTAGMCEGDLIWEYVLGKCDEVKGLR